jgi:hypothetical protein
MNKKFIERLTEFLESEATDYGLTYDYTASDYHENGIDVKIERENTDLKCEVAFIFNGTDIEIELSEDSWEVVREYDNTVKYFWMIIAPELFPSK